MTKKVTILTRFWEISPERLCLRIKKQDIGMETQMDEKNSASRTAGLSVIGGFIVGVFAFLAGLLSVLNEFNYVGAGLCFLAAALAFGLLTNALFRR
jgi:hypothetical protein